MMFPAGEGIRAGADGVHEVDGARGGPRPSRSEGAPEAQCTLDVNLGNLAKKRFSPFLAVTNH